MTEQEAKDRINQCEQEIRKSYQDLIRNAKEMGNKGIDEGVTAIDLQETTGNSCITGFIALALIGIGLLGNWNKWNAISIIIVCIGVIMLIYQVLSKNSRFNKTRDENKAIAARRQQGRELMYKSRDSLLSNLDYYKDI